MNISMPLNLIFKSSSLMANLVLGMIILKKRYILSKYISVILITIGIILCTFASGSNIRKDEKDKTDKDGSSSFYWWCIGVFLMIGLCAEIYRKLIYFNYIFLVSLFLAARMGLYQEVLYKRCGKHPDEALFYTHVIPMPGFLLLAPNILEHFNLLLNSPTFRVPIFNYHVPIQLCALAGTTLCHFMCIKSVYVLTTECTSLTVTLVVTIRKFVSLIFSVFYFNNVFTINHWIGTVLVFVGTVMFTEIVPKLIAIRMTKSQETEPLLFDSFDEPVKQQKFRPMRKPFALFKKASSNVHPFPHAIKTKTILGI
jgi:UDP-xylose/UDP-N-acetylglucosamine transporter B4